MKLSQKLVATRKKIIQLQRKQDEVYETLSKGLGLTEESIPDEWVWDYLFNGGKVKTVLEKLKKNGVKFK